MLAKNISEIRGRGLSCESNETCYHWHRAFKL